MTVEGKVLLNASTVVVGGGVQAAVAFIRYVLNRDSGVQWHFVLSRAVAAQLDQFGISARAIAAEVFDISPAQDRTARRRLYELERVSNPNLVFTFFGPAYVRFRATHLCGVADGWVTHATLLPYRALGHPLKAAKVFLKTVYKGLWLRAADRWVVEADSAKRGLARRWAVPAERIAVIANCCADHYRTAAGTAPLLDASGRFRLLTFAAYYRHKNLEIIPPVAAELSRLGLGESVEFITTLPPGEPALARIEAAARRLGVAGMIRNIGPVSIVDGPRLYASCDAVFMPSLLETFSATYPEAMAMQLPIVTTDLDFAKAICGAAALYYRANDARDAARGVEAVYRDQMLRQRLVTEGKRRLQTFPNAVSKNGALVELIHEMLKAAGPTKPEVARIGRAGAQ